MVFLIFALPDRNQVFKLDRRPQILDNNTALAIARGLFQALPPVDWSTIPCVPAVSTELAPLPDLVVPPFTADELKGAAGKLPSGKAPGPDQVPNEII